LAAKPLFLPNSFVFLEDLTGAIGRSRTNNHVLAKMSTALTLALLLVVMKDSLGRESYLTSRPGPQPDRIDYSVVSVFDAPFGSDRAEDPYLG
jgi:hypothetical protein